MKLKGLIMMKRLLNAILVLALGGLMIPAQAMNDPFDDFFRNVDVNGMARGIGDGINDGAREIDRALQRRAEEQRVRRENLEAQANRGATQEERDWAREQLRSQARVNEQWENVGAQVTGQLANAYINIVQAPVEMIRERQRAANRLQEVAVEADINARANAQANQAMLQQKLDWVKEPRNLATVAGGVGLIVLAGYGAYQGVLLLADRIRQMYGTPTLATETSLLSVGERFEQFIFGKKIESSKVSDAIFNQELEKQFNEISTALKKAADSDDYLPNILLWGPAGTGKTLIAKRLARSSGMHYSVFPASSLSKYSTEEALLRLQELFEDAQKKGIKLVIFMDEAENTVLDRNKITDQKTAKIMTAILSYIGTERTDVCLIAATNRPEDLDDAFLSRCDYRIYVGAPDVNQRARIIKKYVTDYILTNPAPTRVPTIAGRIWSIISKPKPQPRIGVASDAVNDAMIQEIARRTEGFVGRDLSKMVFEMRRRAQVSPNKTLTKAMVEEVVARKLKEHEQQEGGFQRQAKMTKPAAKVAPVQATQSAKSGKARRS